MWLFQLESEFSPAWDQPKAIEWIMEGFNSWLNNITLLWATWTGKTFTMANVIKQYNRPTLILSHNKTLAAQLATEFKYFFPNNAVHYFVSYFDYYQPESYLPEKGVYVEKEATINEEIEMYRLSTMASLLSRKDSIVISSVSALYGLWSKEFFETNRLYLKVWERYSFDQIKEALIAMQYQPVHTSIEQGMFDIQGEMIDIYSSTEKVLYRCIFNFDTLEYIEIKDALTFERLSTRETVTVRPATQYMQDMDDLDWKLKAIENEMNQRAERFEKHDFLVEAQRIRKRVMYDIKMIKETGFVQWIENYSPYFEQRLDGKTPNTLFDYFPDDLLIIVDESHMTVPQLGWMPQGDRSRKTVLIDHGFRLPSAIHHRPLNFDEVQLMLRRKEKGQVVVHPHAHDHAKSKAKTLFVSATPAEYELQASKKVVQQIIRPTGLLDPITYVYPKSWSYERLEATLDPLLKKNPKLRQYTQSYSS